MGGDKNNCVIIWKQNYIYINTQYVLKRGEQAPFLLPFFFWLSLFLSWREGALLCFLRPERDRREAVTGPSAMFLKKPNGQKRKKKGWLAAFIFGIICFCSVGSQSTHTHNLRVPRISGDAVQLRPARGGGATTYPPVHPAAEHNSWF